MIIECSECKAKVDGKTLWELDHLDAIEDGWKFVVLQCRVCKTIMMGITYGHYPTEDIDGYESNKMVWTEVKRLWPHAETEISRQYPETVRVSLKEAKLCFKASAYNASAVMCGRAIEGVCKHHDPETENIYLGLKKLLADGVIEKRIYEWGEELRKKRNLGAHPSIDEVSEEDAKDLLDFTIAICDYVFVLNKRFDEFKARQASREKSKTTSVTE